MKSKRHEKIKNIIASVHVETQEELCDILKSQGFNVTQATVSRDIRDLKLCKLSDKNGKQYYSETKKKKPSDTGIEYKDELFEKYVRVLREGLISVEEAGHLLVIKTMPGMANAVAATLDQMENSKIVGTLAGDDTIFCAFRNEKDSEDVKRIIKLFLN